MVKSYIFQKINHVAIIMDEMVGGQKNDLPKKAGHEYGIKNCINICEKLDKLKYKINEISFYVFSTENWIGSHQVKNLFDLIQIFYDDFS